MSTISVQAQRAERNATQVSLETDLERVRVLAKLLDAQFEIAGVKVGWDAIIGLVPVVGDIVTAGIATYPIYIARKHNMGKALQARMALNVAIDWAIGIVPVAGDFLDVVWKANLKNLALLEKAAAKR